MKYPGQTILTTMKDRLAPQLIVPGLFLVMLAACADTMPPTQQLRAAEQAITSAEQERVADYDSPDLNQAREKLAAAHNAVQNDDMVLAQQLADESRVSAELASAMTATVKAKRVNDEMQKGIDTLKQEMLRNRGNIQ
jgi:hypothetical protein